MDPIRVASALRPDVSIQADPLLQTIHHFLEGTRPLSGQALMNLLALEPDLNTLFLLSAGVGEGYSIGEHTRMVVDSFEKELMDRPETQEILSNAGITSAQFMFFLALHDIGKGRAVQQHPQSDDTRKAFELQYSRDVLSAVCKKVGLENCIPLFLALLHDDAIGDICKSEKLSTSLLAQTANDIRQSAEQCGLFIEDFLPLKQLFHMTDAASYSFVRQRFFLTDHKESVSLSGHTFPQLIGHTGENRHKLARLSHCLRCGELPSAPSHLPFTRDPETLQAIFSRSAFGFTWEEILDLDAWQREIKHLEGNKSPLYCDFKKKLRAIKMDRLPFRTYLQWKKEGNRRLPKEMRESEKSKLKKLASPPHIQHNLRIVERIRFLHGSNSAALAMMHLSGDMTLTHTGALLDRGVAPMCGELGSGITPNGTNMSHISGETIRDLPRVIHYALSGHQNNHAFDPSRTEEYLNPFQSLSSLSSLEWVQLVLSLMHCNRENPQACAEFLSVASPKTRAFIEMLGSHKIRLAKETKEMGERYMEQESKNNTPVYVESNDWDIRQKLGNYEYAIDNNAQRTQQLEKEIAENLQRVHLLDSFHRALLNGILLRAYTVDDLEPYRECGTNIHLHRAEYASAFMQHDRAKMPHWIDVVKNPYIAGTREERWNKHAVNLLQFKQWDPANYSKWHSAYAELFLSAVDREQARQCRPLEQLLALIDAKFTEEDKAIIRERLDDRSPENAPLPEGLKGIFDSLSEISPFPEKKPNFQSAMRDMRYIRKAGFQSGMGPYSWKYMISTLLKEKTQPGAQTSHYDKGPIHNELEKIKRDRTTIANILNTPQSRVQIPEDERIRSLFTHPFPLVFASTCVRPFLLGTEYSTDKPIPLGQNGIDLIFTDSKESKRIIQSILPHNLREKITIDLMEKLDGGGLPLQDKF